MSELIVEFKFEIGDVVFFRTASHSDGNRPRQFLVEEQQAHRCCGGVQLFYKLEGEQLPAPEIALTTEEPPYRPMAEAAKAARLDYLRAQAQVENEVTLARWSKRKEVS